MALAGPEEWRPTARTTERPKRKRQKLPPSRKTVAARRIEEIKGVRYLTRKRLPTPPWGYGR
jgi:hypothetical protein